LGDAVKAFSASLATIIVVAIGAMYALDTVWQQRADEAFAAATSVRLPDQGNTHNLVGKSWYSAKDH
jgi:hypothetical protein